MKTYGIYIKSHCTAPDFEAEVKAETIEEALVIFATIPQLVEFSLDDLRELIEEI